MSRILPREGLTQEALFAPVRNVVFQPLLSGPLLLCLLKYPHLVVKIFNPRTLSLLRSPRAIISLSAIFAVGLLTRINDALSQSMLNNFVSDKTWNWSKEIILITGGSSGIGALMAQNFAKRDIAVIILDITPPEFLDQFQKIHFYQADITSSEKIHATAEEIRKVHGEPTVLINNAGIGPCKRILDESEAEIRRVFEVNTISHFLIVKEFMPSMIQKNHGHIVTIASMASFMVYAQNVDYSCTKASSLAFHEGLAQELKAHYNANRVRTTIVHPSWIRTPLTVKLLAKKEFSDFVLEPETVAEAVVNQVLSGTGAQLILPGRYNLVPLLRGMPSWLQEGMRNGVAKVLQL